MPPARASRCNSFAADMDPNQSALLDSEATATRRGLVVSELPAPAGPHFCDYRPPFGLAHLNAQEVSLNRQ